MVALFGEDNFQDKMESVVADCLKNYFEDAYIQSFDETKLHVTYAVHPQEKASIVISHGFCEFFAKYHEIAYYFYEMGYSVFFLEYRGHGLSDRKVEDWSMVYVKDFDEYVEDLHSFMEQIVTQKSKTKKYVLYAHSMGGAIGALFLEKYPDYFSKAILSSPLMEMNYGKIPKILVQPIFLAAKIGKWDKKYVPGQHAFDGISKYETSSALSKARYDYFFRFRQQRQEYQTYGGCYAWTKAAAKATKKICKDAPKVKAQVLLFQAGLDTLVKLKGQDIFTQRSDKTIKICFPQSKHEIFNATMPIREKYFHIIFRFLES